MGNWYIYKHPPTAFKLAVLASPHLYVLCMNAVVFVVSMTTSSCKMIKVWSKLALLQHKKYWSVCYLIDPNMTKVKHWTSLDYREYLTYLTWQYVHVGMDIFDMTICPSLHEVDLSCRNCWSWISTCPGEKFLHDSSHSSPLSANFTFQRYLLNRSLLCFLLCHHIFGYHNQAF